MKWLINLKKWADMQYYTDTVSPIEGRYYLDRRGGIHGPMIRIKEGFITPVRIDDCDDFDWYQDGCFSLFDRSEFDLISEIGGSLCGPNRSTSGPIRETVKRELVPGQYGNFWIANDRLGRICVTMPKYEDDDALGHRMDAQSLRAAADLFAALADFAEGG